MLGRFTVRGFDKKAAEEVAHLDDLPRYKDWKVVHETSASTGPTMVTDECFEAVHRAKDLLAEIRHVATKYDNVDTARLQDYPLAAALHTILDGTVIQAVLRPTNDRLHKDKKLAVDPDEFWMFLATYLYHATHGSPNLKKGFDDAKNNRRLDGTKFLTRQRFSEIAQSLDAVPCADGGGQVGSPPHTNQH